MNKKIIIFSLVIFFSVALFSSVRVEVAKVVKKEISKKYEFQGFFSAEKSINLFPKIRGVLIRLDCKESDIVKKGELIGMIKRDDPGYKFKPLKILSPATGVIVKINSYEGTRVNPQSPILIISSYNPILLNINLPASFFYKVRRGEKVKVKVNGINKPFEGVVLTKENPGDPKLKTGILRVRVPNKKLEIVPNTLGKIILETKPKEVILAPADSVFSSQDGYFVWVVEGEKAFKRRVKIGDLYGRFFEVLEGLSEGELIVTFGAEKLNDGEQVVY